MDDEVIKAMLAAETKRRVLILQRVLDGLAKGHIFVEFDSAEVVEMALGGPGRRVELGSPDEQGFYAPAVWVFKVAIPPEDDQPVDEKEVAGMLEPGTGG